MTWNIGMKRTRMSACHPKAANVLLRPLCLGVAMCGRRPPNGIADMRDEAVNDALLTARSLSGAFVGAQVLDQVENLGALGVDQQEQKVAGP